MIFPELKLIKRHKIKGKYINQYKMDWSNNKEYILSWQKSWISNYRHIDKDIVDYYFDEILSEDMINEYLFPPEYQHILDDFSNIAITDTYFKEIKHFEDLAKSEWSRDRHFDTCIREGCLSVAEECVDRYFFLLLDCHYIYNKDIGMDYSHNKFYEKGKSEYPGDKYDHTTLGHSMIKPLWLYRFWKHQTGGGLVISKSLNKLNYGDRIKKDFEMIWSGDHIEITYSVINDIPNGTIHKVGLCILGWFEIEYNNQKYTFNQNNDRNVHIKFRKLDIRELKLKRILL